MQQKEGWQCGQQPREMGRKSKKWRQENEERECSKRKVDNDKDLISGYVSGSKEGRN